MTTEPMELESLGGIGGFRPFSRSSTAQTVTNEQVDAIRDEDSWQSISLPQLSSGTSSATASLPPSPRG